MALFSFVEGDWARVEQYGIHLAFCYRYNLIRFSGPLIRKFYIKFCFFRALQKFYRLHSLHFSKAGYRHLKSLDRQIQ